METAGLTRGQTRLLQAWITELVTPTTSFKVGANDDTSESATTTPRGPPVTTQMLAADDEVTSPGAPAKERCWR